jgi:hypothetical protein
MELTDFISQASQVGSSCDAIFSGFEAVYLVPVGTGFSLFKQPELLPSLPDLSGDVFKIELEPESSVLRCKQNFEARGKNYSNSFGFKSIRNISDWLFENRFVKFWLILKQGDRYLITGDDAMPYTFEADYDSAKKLEEVGGFDAVLVSDQIRPFHIYRNAVFTLLGDDFTGLFPFKGDYSESPAVFNGDYIIHLGKAYLAQAEFMSGAPAGNPDYQDLGTYRIWSRFLTVAVDDIVLHDGELYQNTSGVNGFSVQYL